MGGCLQESGVLQLLASVGPYPTVGEEEEEEEALTHGIGGGGAWEVERRRWLLVHSLLIVTTGGDQDETQQLVVRQSHRHSLMMQACRWSLAADVCLLARVTVGGMHA